MSSVNARVPPLRLLAVDNPSDGEVAAYQASSGRFEWVPQSGGGGSGTVTSVALTETGSALTITGSPITSSGTINIEGAGTNSQVILGDLSLGTLTSGTVTSVGLTETGSALTITGSPVTSSGTINIAGAGTSSQVILGDLSLGTLTSGTVTSVGLTETGSALTITGSPVTSSGTINIEGAGTNSQVILGDLSLGTLPTGTIGGTIAVTQVAYGAADDEITGSANMTFDGTNLSVAGYVKSGTGVYDTNGATDLTLQTNQATNSSKVVLKSGSGGNLVFTPDGAGLLEIGGNTNAGAIKLMCEVGTHGITIESAPHSASATYKLVLPDALPADSDNKYLVSDTSGNMSFTSASGGGGGASQLYTPYVFTTQDSSGFTAYRRPLTYYGTFLSSSNSFSERILFVPFIAPRSETVANLGIYISTTYGTDPDDAVIGVYSSKSSSSSNNTIPYQLQFSATFDMGAGTGHRASSITVASGGSASLTEGTLYFMAYAPTNDGSDTNSQVMSTTPPNQNVGIVGPGNAAQAVITYTSWSYGDSLALDAESSYESGLDTTGTSYWAINYSV